MTTDQPIVDFIRSGLRELHFTYRQSPGGTWIDSVFDRYLGVNTRVGYMSDLDGKGGYIQYGQLNIPICLLDGIQSFTVLQLKKLGVLDKTVYTKYMTDETRLKKVESLVDECQFVQEYGCFYRLLFPYPRVNDYADIDQEGKLIDYRGEDGVTLETDRLLITNIVNRRLGYLYHRYFGLTNRDPDGVGSDFTEGVS